MHRFDSGSRLTMSAEQPKWKEIVSNVGIAGGVVAGALGLLASNTGLFLLGALGLGGGYYLKNSH